MERLTIPEQLKGKELFKFLVDNKSALIAQKKAILKQTDTFVFTPSIIKPANAEKSIDSVPVNPDVCHVKVVANTAWYCDSQMDVLLPDNAKKSINERKGLIPHIHDHEHEVTAIIGDVTDIYYQNMSLSELGIGGKGTTQVLIFETDIRKEYNEQIFNLYKSGKIKQHSIGLMYVKIGLAVNDEEMVAEYDLWQKYADKVINQEAIQEKGYFWVVPEIKLLENSAVLFGANPITPTLESKANDTNNEPSADTHIQPSHKGFDIDTMVKNINFFKTI